MTDRPEDHKATLRYTLQQRRDLAGSLASIQIGRINGTKQKRKVVEEGADDSTVAQDVSSSSDAVAQYRRLSNRSRHERKSNSIAQRTSNRQRLYLRLRLDSAAAVAPALPLHMASIPERNHFTEDVTFRTDQTKNVVEILLLGSHAGLAARLLASGNAGVWSNGGSRSTGLF
jgi:hypothetical protein